MSRVEDTPYLHKVQFYETDGMKIVHHSNYIRWMEEGRCDWLAKMGVPYEMVESLGVQIPVLGVNCKYKQAVRYGDTVKIYMTMGSYNGFRMTVNYKIVSMDEKTVHAIGSTDHCFLDMDLKPVNVKKNKPEIHNVFAYYMEEK